MTSCKTCVDTSTTAVDTPIFSLSKGSCCRKERVTNIVRNGDKVIITLDDCTFLEAEINQVQVGLLAGFDSAVTKAEIQTEEDSHKQTLVVETTNFMSGKTLVQKYELKVTGLGKIPPDPNGVKDLTFEQNTLNLSLISGKNLTADLTSLVSVDRFVNSGQIIQGNKLRLLFENSNAEVIIDLAGLIGTNAVSITGMTLEGTNLVLSTSDGNSFRVDIGTLLNQIKQEIMNHINNLSYTIKTQTGNYQTTDEDLSGKVIIHMNENGNAILTLNKPSTETLIGRALIIRKTNGALNTTVTIQNGTGVTIVPSDANKLRRVGSSVTAIYRGNGIYDIYGELA